MPYSHPRRRVPHSRGRRNAGARLGHASHRPAATPVSDPGDVGAAYDDDIAQARVACTVPPHAKAAKQY